MRRTPQRYLTSGLALLIIAGCGDPSRFRSQKAEGLTGALRVDGSSTVYPITEAVAEEFQAENPGVRVSVAISGTGGGFRQFCAAEADISDASRPMKAEELALCRENGIEPIEIVMGWDGISVVVNPANDFVDCLTVGELRRIWEPESDVRTWRDVRRSWPDRRIDLYGPGADSGTLDYFTEAIVGEEGAIRADFTASEDDNVLVQGVAGDRDALGYFGYAYVIRYENRLKLLGINSGEGCVKPSAETIQSRAYGPLARPLFIYINQDRLRAKPEVRAFTEFYLRFAREFLPQVGYVPLGPETYRARIEEIRWRSGAE